MHCRNQKAKANDEQRTLKMAQRKPTRECKYKKGVDYVYSFYGYKECYADKEVDDVVIREDDDEWREPLIEEE